MALTDALIISWCVFGVQLLWIASGRANIEILGYGLSVTISYTVLSVVIIFVWIVLISLTGSRKLEVLGTGNEEYRRVGIGSFRLFATLAASAYLFQLPIARGYVLVAIPLGVLFLIFGRWIWRQWLVSERSRGSLLTRAVILGGPDSAAEVTKLIQSTPDAGFNVVGGFISGHSYPLKSVSAAFTKKTGVDVFGSTDEVISEMRRLSAETLIIANTDHLSLSDVRHLSWQLKPGTESLVVAPAIVDVSGPRLHIRPVSGLPLLQIETPSISGTGRVIKRGIDIFLSLVGLILLSPLLIITSLIIKSEKNGPVLFSQERVGLGGKTFRIYKFRTMVPHQSDISTNLSEIKPSERSGNEVLFKLKDDPRVTKAGRWMRRYSVDELPQLFNVLEGTMSLVGPRPPLESEVELYESHVNRRFYVKPGITGLWQVSGRSDLSWEESVRTDLMYVENWSLTSDFIILWRTVRVVFSGKGAY